MDNMSLFLIMNQINQCRVVNNEVQNLCRLNESEEKKEEVKGEPEQIQSKDRQ